MQEEVRVAGRRGEPGRWLRMRVGRSVCRQARGEVHGLDGRRYHPRPRSAGRRLPGAAARHRLSRPRAGRLLLGRMPRANLVYLNATLADWLGHDLAEFGSGGLKLADIVSGDGAALLTAIAAVPGEVKTEVVRPRSA